MSAPEALRNPIENPQEVIEFSLKSEVNPEQALNAFTSLQQSFFTPLSDEQRKNVSDALDGHKEVEVDTSLGNFMGLFEGSDVVARQSGLMPFDRYETIDGVLSTQDTLMVLGALECMSNELETKVNLSSEQQTVVEQFRTALQQRQDTLMQQWMDETSREMALSEADIKAANKLATYIRVAGASLVVISTMAACTSAPVISAAEVPMMTTPAAMTETVAPAATSTEAPTPTEASAPSMENLPAEWQGKIDHIETMTNMDGKTTRVVAVESLTDEDKAAGKTEAKLRVLQWDGKEWISYVPQVGLISTSSSYWDVELEGGKTILSDDLSSKELQKIVAEPIYGKNGQEIKNGLVADFADATVFCGDLIETVSISGSQLNIIKVDNLSGDIELFMIAEGTHNQDGIYITAYNQNSVDAAMARDPLNYQNQEVRDKISPMGTITLNKYIDYIQGLQPPRRVLFAVGKGDQSLMKGDNPAARKQVVNQYLEGDGFDAQGIGIANVNSFFVSEKDFQALQSSQ